MHGNGSIGIRPRASYGLLVTGGGTPKQNLTSISSKPGTGPRKNATNTTINPSGLGEPFGSMSSAGQLILTVAGPCNVCSPPWL